MHIKCQQNLQNNLINMHATGGYRDGVWRGAPNLIGPQCGAGYFVPIKFFKIYDVKICRLSCIFDRYQEISTN